MFPFPTEHVRSTEDSPQTETTTTANSTPSNTRNNKSVLMTTEQEEKAQQPSLSSSLPAHSTHYQHSPPPAPSSSVLDVILQHSNAKEHHSFASTAANLRTVNSQVSIRQEPLKMHSIPISAELSQQHHAVSHSLLATTTRQPPRQLAFDTLAAVAEREMDHQVQQQQQQEWQQQQQQQEWQQERLKVQTQPAHLQEEKEMQQVSDEQQVSSPHQIRDSGTSSSHSSITQTTTAATSTTLPTSATTSTTPHERTSSYQSAGVITRRMSGGSASSNSLSESPDIFEEEDEHHVEEEEDEEEDDEEEDEDEEEHYTRRETTTKVNFACTCCRKAHKACDGQRPCGRCKRLGITEQCKNSMRKKRGTQSATKKNMWRKLLNCAARQLSNLNPLAPDHITPLVQTKQQSTSNSSVSSSPNIVRPEHLKDEEYTNQHSPKREQTILPHINEIIAPEAHRPFPPDRSKIASINLPPIQQSLYSSPTTSTSTTTTTTTSTNHYHHNMRYQSPPSTSSTSSFEHFHQMRRGSFGSYEYKSTNEEEQQHVKRKTSQEHEHHMPLKREVDPDPGDFGRRTRRRSAY